MATSESDDFESADEELSHDTSIKRGIRSQQWSSPTAIDSESDDDTEFVPRTPCVNSNYGEKSQRYPARRAAATAGEETPAKDVKNEKNDKDADIETVHRNKLMKHSGDSPEGAVESTTESIATPNVHEGPLQSEPAPKNVDLKEGENQKDKESNKTSNILENKEIVGEAHDSIVKPKCMAKERPRNQRKSEATPELGKKKLGTRIAQKDNTTSNVDTTGTGIQVESIAEDMKALSIKDTTTEQHLSLEDEDAKKTLSDLLDDTDKSGVSIMNELAEPEELKSNKKFKDIFTPQGWEGLGTDIQLPEELTEEKLQPVLEKLSSAGEELESPSSGWSGWGNWGVSSLITSATAGVSTLTSHVSHGLTLLEETMGVPDPADLAKAVEEEKPVMDDKTPDEPEENQMQLSFGFGNLISGVSSITKLVESTSTRVMTGGLDTLEAIGKKTMEVLQEGDPGLKKKRAFFLHESDKPNLSHILREAKEKADTAEKTVEEKQLARKVHFESLFDDYQGLVHLEALEMLSKQSNIKIQQHLVGLDTDELTSIQETLEEVKELCDLGDDDDDENEDNESLKDLKLRLEEACKDLGVNISCEKLFVVWEESQSYLEPPVKHTSQNVFQCAISAVAQFTALSVERFHKTAELLLIKERRSTVNEADALVQLTRILSNQIGVFAYRYCNALRELNEISEKSDNVNTNITTIFMEASNASSYIQEAFRLLIPILQVGAM